MKISTEHCPSAPRDMAWSAVTDNYDGVPYQDSAGRWRQEPVGCGATPEEAEADLRERIAERAEADNLMRAVMARTETAALCEAIAECLNTARHAGECLLEMEMMPEQADPDHLAKVNLQKALELREAFMAFVENIRAEEGRS